MRKYLPILLLLPALGYLTAIFLFPLIFEVVLSFFDYNLKRSDLGTEFVGLANYVNAFDPNYELGGASFRFSLNKLSIFVLAAIPIELLLGLALAFSMTEENKIYTIIRPLMLVPMVLSPVVAALIARFLFHQSFGVVNQLLGTPGFEWYSKPSLALPILVLMDVWQWTPFMFLLILAGISSVPKGVIEASIVDGSTGFQQLRWIVLPMIKPIIAVALFFRLLDALKVFDIPWILTRGGPVNALELANVHIFRVAIRYFYIGYGAALSIILLIVSLVVLVAMIKILHPVRSTFEK